MQSLPSFSFCRRVASACGAAALLVWAATAHGMPTGDAPVRLIIKLRAAADDQGDAGRIDKLGLRQGLRLRTQRAFGKQLRVVTVQGGSAAELTARLSADPEVVYAEVDHRVRRAAVPNDPLYSTIGGNGPEAGQWYLRPPNAITPAAIDAQTAWDTTQGSASVVVAVIDTGVRPEHPELAGKLLPGYDFIADVPTANDGDGADADATDPGDAVSTAEVNQVGGPFYHCTTPLPDGSYVGESSSWHGTQVAGLIGALTNNAAGMASVGWNTSVLPVRALGKCGGYDSDIVVAMKWAAGIHMDGVPDNPHPAKVLNLSLGSDDSTACGKTYQDAIDAVRKVGASVIVAAGNSEGHALGSPANCAGVITVAGLRHIGTKVGYSDLGANVALAAPAGNCVNTLSSQPCLYPIVTLFNKGSTGPDTSATGSTYTDGVNASLGTSFSTPMVSGAAALMLAVQPQLTPDQIKARLQQSARPFPTTGADAGTKQCTAPTVDANNKPVDEGECYCTTATCGAGMLDVRAAVLAAQPVMARIAVSPASPVAGAAITLDASGSVLGAGRAIASVVWSLTDGAAIAAFTGATTGPSTTIVASAAGSFTVAVTVTDTLGSTSTTSQRVDVAAAPVVRTPAPAPSGGGGGGGALGVGYLAALLLAVVCAGRVSRRSAVAAANGHRQALHWLPAVVWALAMQSAPPEAEARALQTDEADRPAHGLIVQLKPAAGATAVAADDPRWAALAEAAGLQHQAWRAQGRTGRLLAAEGVLTGTQARELAQRLRASPQVAWVEPNVRERPLQAVTPSDTGFSQQWWLMPVSGSDANVLADRLRGVPGVQTGWSRSTGDPSIVVAVLDTGFTAHPELAGQIIPGYDFVSDVDYANDGDGRDADPSDPGDWVDASDKSRSPALFGDCELSNSSWHGSNVAGQLVALTNNGTGVAAMQWSGKVLAVRVAGKCGATVADIIDGMRWAAGLPVAGAPVNSHPARIVNVSFGGDAPCSQAYQAAIDELAAVGAVVVAAAGNDGGAVSRPANCQRVLGVAAVNRDGFKAHYSNFGVELALATVGGDPNTDGLWGQLLGDNGLLTIDNKGTKQPGDAGYAYVFGTSFSAPLVSGAAGLMLAVNNQLTASQLIDGLRRSARPHVTSTVLSTCSNSNPGRCLCTAQTCGTGLLDVPEALRYATDPAGYAPPARVGAVLDSAELRSAVALGADAPANPSTPTPVAPSTGGTTGGGGGGALGLGWLLALVAATVAAWRLRRR